MALSVIPESLHQPALDPVTFEVLRSLFEYTCARMSQIRQKSWFPPILYDMVDFSNAIYDADLQLLGQTANCPVHLAAMQFSARATAKRFGVESLKEGDVIVLNDPYEGGTHINDITFTVPIFFRWTDLGGGAAGGQAFGTHIAAEGLRLPPIKLFENYTLNEDFFESTGGGGWGDPLERDVAKVLADVLDEYTSLETAREVYGVVIDPRTLRLDEAATHKLRAER